MKEAELHVTKTALHLAVAPRVEIGVLTPFGRLARASYRAPRRSLTEA
jgi:hypothetical protein